MQRVQDRTQEFHACVQSLRTRVPSNVNLSKRQDSSPSMNGSRSSFARNASEIALEIAACSEKLQRLSSLAQRKTLFDDRSVEVTELTHIIKQRIANLNLRLADLQASMQSSPLYKKSPGAFAKEHHDHIVTSLQNQLANASRSFKDVLESRSKSLKAAKLREAHFVPKESSNSGQLKHHMSANMLKNLERRSNVDRQYESNNQSFEAEESSADTLTFDLSAESTPNTSFQQMDLLEKGSENSYLQERGTAIESIERTIVELGNMFSQLTHMVAEQRETIQRIDLDTDDIATNVADAQREIHKLYLRVTNQRWFLLKLFGVLIIFFFLFVLVS